jgi:GNAT superfamily N-acetyltransferase
MIKLVKGDKDTIKNFVMKYHYSKIFPRLTKHWLWVTEDGETIGAITLGWGTQPLQTIQKLFPGHTMSTSNYLEIGKMCFLPEYNGNNYGSKIMAALVKYVRAETDSLFLYTLADGIMGKCGYVYQASNFRYIGKFATSVYMDRNTSEKIHPRSCRKLCQENADYEHKEKVFWLSYDFCEHKQLDKITGLMFRYIYPLTKVAKRLLECQYPSKLSNPKDVDLLFRKRVSKGKSEIIPMPVFDMDVFNHNYQQPRSE